MDWSPSRSSTATVALAAVVLFAGCSLFASSPEVVEQQCGNFEGAGGCEVTVENPSDESMDVVVTVEALDADGNVVAEGTETITVPAGEQASVIVAASNAGGDVDRYEVTSERA